MMMLSTWTRLSMVLAACAASLGGARDQTFGMPESVLLFGNYNELRIIAPDRADVLHPTVERGYNHSYFAYPSIASRGDSIAWGFAVSSDDKRDSYKARFALGLYSRLRQSWKTYGDFDQIGDAGISSDGSKVAVVARQEGRLRLVIFDVATETIGEGPYQRGMSLRGTPSWSPDRKRLAVQIHRPDESSFVAVLDLNTGETRPLGDGFQPQWSRDGQWVAYYSGRKCMLVHPDGSGSTVALTLKDGWFTHKEFGWGSPVWSPDSRQLLLNVTTKGGPYLDVILLDVATGRTTTKSQKGLPIFGWAR
jgi:Tol biopolymer transport system component